MALKNTRFKKDTRLLRSELETKSYTLKTVYGNYRLESTHCKKCHNVADDVDGEGDAHDDADQTDAMQPEISDANGGDDVVIRQRDVEPKRRYGPKKPEPKAAASERRQKGSAGDQETQNAKQHKRKVAPKKASKPE